jgi:non-specific serine/threonine protein kinase
MIGRTISHYHIEAELGRGGMGVVYRATDTKLGRSVALKLLPEEIAANPELRARLVAEARAAAALNHPHICTMHEVGEAEGRAYIAMEHVTGVPLSQMLARGALPVESVVRYGAQVAAALAHAHEHGVVHRDLKSLNIVITPDGRAKVLDFGLARHLEKEVLDAATRSLAAHEPASISGTLHYLPPEVLRGSPGEARGDIWALGVVLYEMAAGRLPFGGQTGFEISSAILRETPQPLPPHIPAGLRGIIQRCLAKEAGERYQQATEVRAALEAVASDSISAVSAPPPVAAAAHRRRSAFFLAAGALIVLAVLLGWKNNWWRGEGREPERIRSLAILPLRAATLQAEDDYLGMGIADTIITKVSQIGELTVRPPSAVRKYARQEVDALEAARQLQVDSVLDGTYQRGGERLRVNLNLLRVRGGTSLWSESFDVRSSDVFAMQDEVAHKVASGLRLQLSPSEQERMARRYTSSAEAYEYFVKGMYNFDKRSLTGERRSSLEAAITMFKKAIERDPNYALARAQLAYSYAWMALFIEPGQHWLDMAKEELRRAEAQDPNLALLHVVRHELLWSIYEGFQLEASIRELRIAQSLDPSVGHDQLGVLYAHMGLEEPALREARRAVQIDPTSEISISRYVEAFDLLGRPDEAIAANRQYGELPGPTTYLRKTHLWAKQFDEVQKMIDRQLAGNPQDPQGLSAQALLRTLQGDFATLEKVVPTIVEKGRNSRAFHHMTYNIASAYALQGKSKPAVEWMRKTVEFGMPNYTLFSRDPHLDAIRKDPAFVQFVAELKPRWEAFQREFGK